jgi:hypothetical protein
MPGPNIKIGLGNPKLLSPYAQASRRLADVKPVGAKTQVGQSGFFSDVQHVHNISGALDTVAADIQPVGITNAVGNAGLAADAKHIHQGTPRLYTGSLAGAWPATANFTTVYANSRLIVQVSATAIKTTAVGFFEIDVSVDGGNQGASGTFSNNFGIHVQGATVYCADILVAAGAHTLVVSLNQVPGSSSSDTNDRAYWQVLEFPKAN